MWNQLILDAFEGEDEADEDNLPSEVVAVRAQRAQLQTQLNKEMKRISVSFSRKILSTHKRTSCFRISCVLLNNIACQQKSAKH